MNAVASSPDVSGRDGGREVAASPWGRFTRVAIGTAAFLFAAALAFLLAVDPYDTGRTGLIPGRGVHAQFPSTAGASRARDPRFDAAIVGNSHVQKLRPERLDRLTGLSFVSLIMPATWPPDQFEVLRWLLASRRTPPRAIVMGIDQFWCVDDLGNSPLFPRWLYAARFPVYLAGLVRFRSFEASAARLHFLRTGKNGARPDGFWDYADDYARLGLADLEASGRHIARPKPFTVNLAENFPALDRLRTVLATIPAETAVILLRPPVYRTGLPQPGTVTARAEAACRTRIEEVASSRPRTAMLDFIRPGPDTDDPANFYDHDHFREGLAMTVEAAIAAALARLDQPGDGRGHPGDGRGHPGDGRDRPGADPRPSGAAN